MGARCDPELFICYQWQPYHHMYVVLTVPPEGRAVFIIQIDLKNVEQTHGFEIGALSGYTLLGVVTDQPMVRL